MRLELDNGDLQTVHREKNLTAGDVDFDKLHAKAQAAARAADTAIFRALDGTSHIVTAPGN